MTSRFVFTSNCILAQAVMAEGASKTDKSMIRMVIDWAFDNDINIQQMRCPEAMASGLNRQPQGYKKYAADKKFQDICKLIARSEARNINEIIEAGHDVIGIIGVVFSPACSTIKDSKSVYHPHGVYMQRLSSELKRRKIDVPFVSVTPKWKNKSMENLNTLISKQESLL